MTFTTITTVGTSIFSNYMKEEAMDSLGDKYQSINDLFERLSKDTANAQDYHNSRFANRISNIKERVEKIWLPFAHEKSCAELQTLQAIAAENSGAELEVYLLATDTVLSIVACELIKTWLDQGNIKGVKKCVFHADANAPDTTVIKGLQIEKADRFRQEGFSNLLNILQKFAVKDNTVLNISGGYKAVIPYLTLYAQLEGIPLKYMYEDSAELITVGNMPVDFDFSLFTDEYIAFEMIKPDKSAQNLPSKPSFIENLSTPDSFQLLEDNFLIVENGGKIQLSLLGQMLYRKYEAIQKEDGFSASNLLGKVMEVKVFEFFQSQYPNAVMRLGKNIGASPQGDPYDIDVWVETEQMIWALEVKPQNVDVLTKDSMKEKKKKETLEYKCAAGAFFHTRQAHQGENLNLAVVMYHHVEPHPLQAEAFKKLKKEKGADYIRWIWLKPNAGYKGNVNWSVGLDHLKEFNFRTSQWDNFKL